MEPGSNQDIMPRNEEQAARASGVPWILLIYFFSGACSLIDEVVWVRLLKLTVGNTVYASSIVVSVFMAGLSLGAFLMARSADRVKKRLRLYAILEVCVTVSALLLPLALQTADSAYRWFYGAFQPSPAVLLIVQVLLSALILLVPSMLMGSTLPLLGRYVTSMEDRVGRRVGGLYALNMLGAGLGCFLAGFVFIRAVGLMGTLYLAAAMNLLVALAGWILSRRHETSGRSHPEDTDEKVQVRKRSEGGDKKSKVLFLAFFASGFISIGFELIWIRSFSLLLGGFTYVFSAVLTFYLVGNVIGAWIGSRLSRRLERPAIGFGVSLMFLGCLGVLYFPFLCLWYLSLSSPLMSLFGNLRNLAFFQSLIVPVFHSIFVFLVPSIIMGIGFPLALQAWGELRHKVGLTTGTVYGINTIGAVLGGLLTGFVLIPITGAQLSISLLGLFGVWLGGAMIPLFSSPSSSARRLVPLLFPAAFTALLLLIPSTLFEEKFVRMPKTRTLAVKEGVTTTVAVVRTAKGKLRLATDNVVIGGDGIQRSAQQSLGHLGPFLHREATDALSIGFGTGETTLCLTQHDLQSIDCVEIAPEVVEMALQHFSHINLGEKLADEVTMLYMDGKNYLHLVPREYDLIINGANVPTHSGSAPMFAKEHFQNALARLRTAGLFMTKLHIWGESRDNFDSILGTFLSVFPHVTIWFPVTRPYNFFYLVGSRESQVYSPKHMEDKLNEEGIRKSAGYLFFKNSIDILGCYIGDERDIERYLGNYSTNSDCFPYVEFSCTRKEVLRKPFFSGFLEVVRSDSILRHIDWTGMTVKEKEQWKKEFQSAEETVSSILRSYGEKNVSKRLQILHDALKRSPGHSTLVDQEEQCLMGIEKELTKNPAMADKALADMQSLLKNHPTCGAAWLISSWAQQVKKRLKRATQSGEKAARFAPYLASAQNNLGLLYLKKGNPEQAIAHYRKALESLPSEFWLHFNLGSVLAQLGKLDEAIVEVRKAIHLQPYQVEGHCKLGDLLRRSGQTEEAERAYRKALQIDPLHEKAIKKLHQLTGS